MSTPMVMSSENCTIDYKIPYHFIMEYSPYFTVWFYIYIAFFVIEQGSNKFSHHHFAILHHEFWNFVHQMYVCVFYRPVAHLPMFGFQIGGVTRSWGLNAIELWIFWVWILFAVFLSIVHLFYARLYTISHMIVLNKYRTLVHWCTFLFCLAILIAITCGSSILLVFLSTPFVVEIKTNAFLKYNNRIIFCPDFAIVDLSMWQTVLPNALAACGLALLFFIMVFLGTASCFVLSTKSSSSSLKTLKTQQVLMKSFLIQAFTHTLFLFIPAVVCAVLAVFDRLRNVEIYTAIFSLAHQGVMTIIIFVAFTPTTATAAKSFSVIRLVNWMSSYARWILCCGVVHKKTLPALVRVKANSTSNRSLHPPTVTQQ